MPEISVILPTYNECENIKNIIEDILNNLPNSIEIIVVDGDSRGGTWKIVEEMPSKGDVLNLVEIQGRQA